MQVKVNSDIPFPDIAHFIQFKTSRDGLQQQTERLISSAKIKMIDSRWRRRHHWTLGLYVQRSSRNHIKRRRSIRWTRSTDFLELFISLTLGRIRTGITLTPHRLFKRTLNSGF